MRCGGLLACRGCEALVNISRPRQIAGDYQQREYLADQGTHRVARIEDMQFADKLMHYAPRASPGRLEARPSPFIAARIRQSAALPPEQAPTNCFSAA